MNNIIDKKIYNEIKTNYLLYMLAITAIFSLINIT